ncbi:MAG: hypothetical protein H7X92_11110 [Chitinophagales bacterium]|nr:hypothetical protein [Hyphomicrobiales bacterium]
MAIDESVLTAVRQYAAKHNTTLNGLVQDYLTRLATFEDRAANARNCMMELSEQSKDRISDWTWNREEIYDRPLLSRHEHPDLRGFAEEGGGSETKEGGGTD